MSRVEVKGEMAWETKEESELWSLTDLAEAVVGELGHMDSENPCVVKATWAAKAILRRVSNGHD